MRWMDWTVFMGFGINSGESDKDENEGIKFRSLFRLDHSRASVSWPRAFFATSMRLAPAKARIKATNAIRALDWFQRRRHGGGQVQNHQFAPRRVTSFVCASGSAAAAQAIVSTAGNAMAVTGQAGHRRTRGRWSSLLNAP